MAGITSLRERFFKPITVTIESETGPVDHDIIGLTETMHGVRDGPALAGYISTALLTGLTGTAAETVFQDVMVMSDDGKDLDDELAKVLMKSLQGRDLTKCHGYIANLAPADMRARLARGTLDQLGMTVGVGIGSAMTDNAKTTEYEFDVPYLAEGSDHPDGVQFFADTLQELEDGSVSLVLLSGLTDAWKLLDKHRELFKQKIGRVVIMGGIEAADGEVMRDDHGYMIPDKAQNNTFDWDAATNLYATLQQECIPMTVVSRWAAYAAKLPLTIYDRMAATGHPVGERLVKAQRHSLEHLWKRCCMPDKDPNREGLPGRCDKNWFSNVFLAGKGKDRSGDDSIWDLTGTFQAYDPVALLAAMPGVRDRFLDPITVTVEGNDGIAYHEVLGLSEDVPGVKQG